MLDFGSPVSISPQDIETVKQQIVAGGSEAYTQMIKMLGNRILIEPANLIPGTVALRTRLAIFILVTRLLLIAVPIYGIVFRQWWLLAYPIAHLVIFNPIQTAWNLELGARVIAVHNVIGDRLDS